MKVSILRDETFFINEYIARGGVGKIGLVSPLVGDIAHLEVPSEKVTSFKVQVILLPHPEQNWIQSGKASQKVYSVKTSS